MRALIVNRREAQILTGAATPEEGAEKLSEVAETAVVTLGPQGAVAMVGDRLVSVDGTVGTPVVDTTGAGDLFAAALAWTDLLGADAEVGIAWANLYAGLSVGSHTGIGGAVTRDRLVEEGEKRGLPPLPA